MLVFIACWSRKSSSESVHLRSFASAFAIPIQNISLTCNQSWSLLHLVRANQSPNESAQSRYIEQNAFKTFRRRRHEIDVTVVVVASAKAQTCAHLRTQTQNRRCCCCFCKSSDVCAFAHAWQSLSYSVI